MSNGIMDLLWQPLKSALRCTARLRIGTVKKKKAFKKATGRSEQVVVSQAIGNPKNVWGYPQFKTPPFLAKNRVVNCQYGLLLIMGVLYQQQLLVGGCWQMVAGE